MTRAPSSSESAVQNPAFVWLEITPSCQLRCQHCYARSGPHLGHGQMRVADWKHVMTELAAHGTRFVQFIGGEPTIHPHFAELLAFAGDLGLGIEVYSNLISISTRLWDLFVHYHIHLATSFYSHDARIHDAITSVVGSQQKTLHHMQKALRLGLRLRVGMIQINEQQDIEATKRFLITQGVKAHAIGVDRTRGVGRGVSLRQEDPVEALCGKCINNRCAVTASGEVYLCIFSRSLPIGNVLKQDINSIVTGETMRSTVNRLSQAFAHRQGSAYTEGDCDPDCEPECDPVYYPPCTPDCSPETIASCEPDECSPDVEEE